MTALTKYAGTALSVQSLKGALQTSINESGRVSKSGDTEYLQFDREGFWKYGKDEFEPDPEGTWVIAPPSLFHGFICWHQKQVEWKQVVPMTQSISRIAVPTGLKGVKGAEVLRGFVLACTSGDDEGVTVEFGTNTRGGLELVEKIVDAITDQIDVDPARIWPVVKLDLTSYNHKEHGKVYKPVMEIVGWMTVEEATGAAEAGEEPAPEPEAPKAAEAAPAAAPRRGTRRADATAAAEPPAETAPPVAEGTDPARRRRRQIG